MKKFEDRRKIKQILYSKPVLAFLLILIAVLSRAVWYSFRGSQIARENLEIAAIEKSEIASRISSLEKDINELKTDRGKEEAFRSKFGMVREGEEVIVLIDDEDSTTNNVGDDSGFWHGVLRLFKRD